MEHEAPPISDVFVLRWNSVILCVLEGFLLVDFFPLHWFNTFSPPFRLFLHVWVNQVYLHRWTRRQRRDAACGRICANSLDFSVLCLHSGLFSKPDS